MTETYLRTGLESAIGVATPNALMRCCIVGVAEVMRIVVPGWFVFGPLIIWSGDSASGLYPRDTSRPLFQPKPTNQFYICKPSKKRGEIDCSGCWFFVCLFFSYPLTNVSIGKINVFFSKNFVCTEFVGIKIKNLLYTTQVLSQHASDFISGKTKLNHNLVFFFVSL